VQAVQAIRKRAPCSVRSTDCVYLTAVHCLQVVEATCHGRGLTGVRGTHELTPDSILRIAVLVWVGVNEAAECMQLLTGSCWLQLLVLGSMCEQLSSRR